MSTTVLCPQQTVLGFPWKYCPYGCSPLAIDFHEKAHAAVYGIPSTCQPPLSTHVPYFAFSLPSHEKFTMEKSYTHYRETVLPGVALHSFPLH